MKQSKEPIIDRIAQLAMRYPSRSAAARAWGININTLKSYYRKDTPPAPRENQLLRIAEREGVSLEWLKNGDSESPEKPPTKSTKSTKSPIEKDTLYEMLEFLTIEERQLLTTMLARKGVETILYLLDEDNIELLRLDTVVKEKILGKQPRTAEEEALNSAKARECDTDHQGQEIHGSLADKQSGAA